MEEEKCQALEARLKELEAECRKKDGLMLRKDSARHGREGEIHHDDAPI